jgi:hypothetical protein
MQMRRSEQEKPNSETEDAELKFTGSWLYRGMANHGGMVG